MDSEKVTQTFNGRAEWSIAAAYFKLMSTVSPVDLKLYKGGRIVHQAAAVEGGYYQRISYDKVEITTPALEAVSWLYAPDQGGSDRLTITGTVSTAERDGFIYSSVYATNAALGAGAIVTAVAPGTNVNGLTLWSSIIFTAQAVAAANSQILLTARASAPSNMFDGEPLLMTGVLAQTAVGNLSASAQLPRSVKIAAGKGLYFVNGGAAESFGFRSLLFTLL